MNPRIKKILRNILFLLAIPLLISAFVFALQAAQQEIYQGMEVVITNTEIGFVSEEDIIGAIEDEGILPGQKHVKDLNIHYLESLIRKNPWVEKVNVYISSKQILHVTVAQKEALVRVQPQDTSNAAYYLDRQANPFPLSDACIVNVPVVTAVNLGYSREALDFKTSLTHLAEFIQQDSFWNAACGQIDVLRFNDVRIIPTLGKVTILLGDLTDYEDKLNRLKTFYQRGLKTVDWSLYDELDARYRGQIVCRNSKGLVLAEDPYESVADAQERIRIKTGIERAEQQAAKQKQQQEAQRAKEKEAKAKQEALEKAKKEKALAQAEKEKLKQQHKQPFNPTKSKNPTH